jgi:hypothetical protein
MLWARNTDQGAVLDVPDIRVAIPVLERCAIEYLCPAFVIFKVDRLRMHELKDGWNGRSGRFQLRI